MSKRLLGFVGMLAILTILIVVAFYPHIFQNVPFIGGYDLRGIYRLFYQEYKQLIQNSLFQGTLPFWSWNTFLGSNFWASKSYYLLGDVYNYLFILTDLHYYTVLLFITILKLYVSAISFYFYGKYRKWDMKWIILGSLFFSFSAWAMEYIEQPMFMSFYSLIPLYFYGVEKILKEKKHLVFVAVSFLLVCINYYLFLTLTICSVIYYFYRYIELHRTIKGSVVSILSVIPFYLMGVGLAAPILIPSAFYIIMSERVTSAAFNLWCFDDIRIYIHILTTFFVPSSTFITKSVLIDGIPYFTSLFEPSPYQVREILVWAGSLTTIMLIYSLFDKDRLRRNLNLSYIIFIISVMILPIGNAIMHGAIEPTFRWLMFPTFMNIIIAMDSMHRYETFDFRRIKYIVIIVPVIIIMMLIRLQMLAVHPFSIHMNHFIVVLVYLTSFVLMYFLLLMKKTKLIVIASILELILVGYLSVYDHNSINEFTWEYIEDYERVLGNTDQLNYVLREEYGEKDFYRIYAPEDSIYWYMSMNTNLLYNYSDVKTYDSAYQPELKRLAQWLPQTRPLPQIWNIEDPYLIDFLSVKYAVVTNASELPHSNFEQVGEYNGLLLYKNLNYRPVMKSVSELIRWEYVINNESSILQTYGIVDGKVYEEVKSYMKATTDVKAENVNLYQNMLMATMNADDSAFIVTSIAYDEGWRVFVDEVETKKYSANGGFISFVVPQGSHQIKLYFQPAGFKMGAIVCILSFVSLIAYVIYVNRRKQV